MKEKKCIHPRKVHKVMQEFLNTASDLVYYDEDDEVFYKAFIRLHKGDCFQADVADEIENDEVQDIYYNFPELFAKSSKIYRKFWIEKYPMLKGFSDITISLLHELGHLETNDKIRHSFSIDQREAAIEDLDNRSLSYKALNHLYFVLPDEKAATEWAFKWLAKKKNRKIAKKFEKEFFKCFEKTS